MSGHTAVGKQWTALSTIGGWRCRFLTAVSGGKDSTRFIFVIGLLVLGILCAGGVTAQPGGAPPGPPSGPPGGPPSGPPTGETPPSTPPPAPAPETTSTEDKATEEDTGLQATVIDVSFPDQKLTEVADLLSTLGGVNINVSGSVDPKILVNYSVKTEKTIRQVLDDLASLYDLWVDTAPDGSVTIRPGKEKPTKAEDIKEKTFPVRFSRPSEILDLVRTFLSSSEKADAIALDSQKVIVVRDIPEALARIEEFLNRVDIPKQSTVFPILYGDPQEIADIIKERLPDLEEGALTVDVANSQIIVKTTLENLAEIQLLIETLDVKKEIRVFTVSFHEVEDIVDMLEELNLLSEEGTLVSNEYTGKLIIQDTSERLDRIAEAIKVYDTPRPAVFVEAEIMDVNAAYSFGWSPTLTVGDVKSAARVGDDTGTVLLDDEMIVNLAGTDAFSFAALDAGTLLAELQAKESDSDSKTIASPRLIVERGEEARLNVGSEEPIGVRSYSNSIYNQSDIVTQRVREVGIRLIVEAMNISERGYTELYIGLENSSVPPDGRIDIGGGTTGLRVLTANIETTAVLKDGRTLAVGGLLTRDYSQSSGGTPFLNRVPLIRYFFSNLAKADTKRKLLLFVTPHILNLDSPTQKYMQDEDAFAQLEGKRKVTIGKDSGLAGIEDLTGSATEISSEEGETDEGKWVNVGGKWGFYDENGRFVDRTSEFMGAIAQEGEGEGQEKITLTPNGKESEASTASQLLRQLKEPALPAQPALQPEVPVIKEEAPAPPVEPVELKKEAVPTPEKAPEATEPQPKPSPKVGEVLSGEASVSAMRGSANSIGKFKGSLRDLIRRVGSESGVKRFGISRSIDQKTFDSEVEIDATGKTFDQIMKEGLEKKGLNLRYRKSDPPQILKTESNETSSPPPASGTPAAPAPPAPTAPPAGPPSTQPQSKAIFEGDDPWTESPASRGWNPQDRPGASESGDWSTLSGTQASAGRSPAPTQQREPWEVSYQSDHASAPRSYQSLSAPAGFERMNQPPTMTEDAWDQLLDGYTPSDINQEDLSSDTIAGPARHTEVRTAPRRGNPNLNPPTKVSAEPASMVVSHSKSEVPKKKGAWSKIKKLLTPGRQE